MGSLVIPARSRRALAKGETEEASDGSRDDRGTEVPKKRVTTVEGSVPVTNRREGETRRVYTAQRQTGFAHETGPRKAKIAAGPGYGIQ